MPNLTTRLVLILQFILIAQLNAAGKNLSLNNIVLTRMQPPATISEALRISLYLLKGDNSIAIADGVYAQYNNSFSNGVDIKDAAKLTNVSENFAIERDGVLLTLERRQIISFADTLFFNLTQTTQRNYQFEFIPDMPDHRGLVAFLQDSYLNTSTAVDLTATTKVNFTVNDEAASATAKRFRVIFASTQMIALPLQFTSVNTYQKNFNTHLAWRAEPRKNRQHYPVEKRGDGRHFLKTGIVMAYRGAAGHQWDAGSVAGNHYNQVSSTGNMRKFTSSTTNKVFDHKGTQGLRVYPNPVVNGSINVQITNQQEGAYAITFSNLSGQVFASRQIQCPEGTWIGTLKINQALPRGNYVVKVKTPGKANMQVNVFCQ